MKYTNILFTLLGVLLSYCLAAQTNKKNINYTYDAAGNRKTRTTTITLNKKSTTDTIPSSYVDEIKVSNTTEMVSKYTLSVYPNPTSEVLSISIEPQNSTIQENTSVSFYLVDAYGRIVMKEITQTTGVVKLNTINLVSGFYFLNIVTNQDKKSYRIVKI